MSEPPKLGPLEIFLMAPIGAGLIAREEGPEFVARCVDRGRESLERHLVTARGTGQLVVAFGVPMLKQRIAGLLDRSGPVPAPEAESGSEAVTPVATPAGDSAPPAGPGAEELPIAAYDALSASQVVEHLDGLGADDLAAVRAYETNHRGRRTILGRIEQLAG